MVAAAHRGERRVRSIDQMNHAARLMRTRVSGHECGMDAFAGEDRGRRRTLLTLAEVAAQLGVSKATVWRRIQRGDLGAFRDGGILRVPQAEIDAYLAARTTASRAPQVPAPPPRCRH